MKQITGLKAVPIQSFSADDPNGGGTISFTFYFRPRVREWFMDITFKTFTMNGYKITRSPDILASYANVIPFGLMVLTTDLSDPFLINDFTSGRTFLYLMNSAEVTEMEALINAGTVTG
jgi:hypothetical protein